MATIYLSSTYEDLKDFRSAVVHALRQSEYRVIAMEDYVASDQRPVDKCLGDVEKADIYVGLFAFRYGYIPPSEHNNPKGLSITELELRHAQHHKKPCLTFLADQKASGFPAAMMDAFTGDGEAGKHIKRLRDEFGRERTASFFSAPYHLASLVQAAMTSHLATHNTLSSSSTPQAPVSTAVTWDIEKVGSPYPGLMHFTRKYAPVFFGREAEICDVLDRLRLSEGRFLIISGASGTGKSSLIDAGVLPRLEMVGANEGYAYHCVRIVPSRGSHPFDALMRPLHEYAAQAGMDAYTVSEQMLNQPDHLSQVLRDIASKCFKNGELVLFLDQMEELFTDQNLPQAHNFLAVLYRAAQETPFRVIATIRSDFLHRCHEQPDLLRILNGQGHIGLGPIDAGCIREMILKPAQCSGLFLSEKLVRRLTGEVGYEPGGLPLVAFALEQLFHKREGKKLTEQAYDDMGGLAGAISQKADQVMAEVGEEAQGAFDSVFSQLIHVERDRPPTRKRASLAAFKLDTAANQLIEALAGPKCRILVKRGEGSEATVEVAHEELFRAWTRLRRWIDGSEDRAGAISQKADQVMAEVGEEAQGAFDSVFSQLVHVERHRPPTRKRASLAAFKVDTAANQLIEALAGPKCRILVKRGEGSEATVEVAYEKLLTAWPRLNYWIDSNDVDLRMIEFEEECAKRWHEKGCRVQGLWGQEQAVAVQRAVRRFKKTPSAQLRTMMYPQEVLIERLNDVTLSHQDRLLIGQKLAEFGDPRPGVGVKDGLPDILWIEIPGGSIKLVGINHVFQVKTFNISMYPVTNAQFQGFLNTEDGYLKEEWWKEIKTGHITDIHMPYWQEANCPREMVSWYEAIAFCRWLSAKTRTNIRLPTQWEWQQAATGGDPQREYPWEGGWDASRCNSKESGLRRTTAVGIYPQGATQPGVKGVLDMAGNVWEWCVNKTEKLDRPEALHIDNEGRMRAACGGAWDNEMVDLRLSRGGGVSLPDSRTNYTGFRLVQDIP